MIDKCEQCNADFESKAVHQMFCGDRCRKAYNRRVHRAMGHLESGGLMVRIIRSGTKGGFWVVDSRTSVMLCDADGLDINGLESWVTNGAANQRAVAPLVERAL